ncbi:MAG: putative ABC transporter ATP-binding protein [Firmicutes bacterium ADurb.Bin153]|nr:MAG: putative ABC transporter ATP-binding protein [Firmicutes bacterium ADurb.Bin153]
MRRLFSYLKPYRTAAIAAPLLMLLEVAADLIQPKMMAGIVDIGIANRDLAYVYRTGAGMIGIALIGLIGGTGATIFSCTVAANYGKDLRGGLFEKVQSFSFAELDRFKTASLITRLTNDVTQIQHIVMLSLRMLVRAPLLAVGGVMMALSINAGLASVLLISLPLLGVALTLIMSKSFPMFTVVQKRIDKLNGVMRENLTGARVVRAFVRSGYEKDRFGKANEGLSKASLRAVRTVNLTAPAMMAALNISLVAVLWFGGIKVDFGTMSVGEVMAFVNYITQILMALQMVAFLTVNISRAKASSERLAEVLDAESSITGPAAPEGAPGEGKVEFRNVSFCYEGASGDPVLKNVDVTAFPGRTLAILGATGSGKSTLVNLIPRFFDPTEGTVLVDGTDVRDMDLAGLRASVGMVLQDPVLFTGTIRDNIMWGKADATDEEVTEAAKAAQAHDFITSLPEGYDTVVGQKGANLSGGQKQRLAIARALVRKPRVLVLDDSTSAIDMGTEERLQAALKEYMRGRTTIVIAQRISSVMDADEIIVLEDGEVVARGTHHQLVEGSEIYRDIVRSQLGAEVV